MIDQPDRPQAAAVPDPRRPLAEPSGAHAISPGGARAPMSQAPAVARPDPSIGGEPRQVRMTDHAPTGLPPRPTEIAAPPGVPRSPAGPPARTAAGSPEDSATMRESGRVGHTNPTPGQTVGAPQQVRPTQPAGSDRVPPSMVPRSPPPSPAQRMAIASSEDGSVSREIGPAGARQHRLRKTLAQQGEALADQARTHRARLEAARTTSSIFLGASLVAAAKRAMASTEDKSKESETSRKIAELALALAQHFLKNASRRECHAILATHPWLGETRHG